jgi:polyhydroxyalkanoate synthesis regulator phasin
MIAQWYTRTIALAFVASFLVLSQTAQAQFSDVGYSGSATGEYILFDDQAGLSDGFLYGGRLGLSFGEYLQLRGLYTFGENIETDFSGFSGNDEAVLAALRNQEGREIDLQRYGAQLQANFGSEGTIPFVQVGTGVIEIDPQDRFDFGSIGQTESIYAEAGVGLRFPVGRSVTVSVVGQGLAYRYNPGSALLSDQDIAAINEELPADEQITRDVFNQQTVFNPSVSAAIGFRLGGRPAGQQTAVDEGFRGLFSDGLQLTAEPFYGTIDFNDALNFPSTQSFAGINVGADITPLIALRAFYWRATDAGEVPNGAVRDWFQDLQLYGGELELRLDTEISRGITPYVLVGGGYAEVLSDYRGRDGAPVDSRYFASGGGGLDIPVTERIGIRGGVRGLLMSNQDVSDVSSPNSVFASVAYTAGLTFTLGQSRQTTEERRATAREREFEQEIAEARSAEEQRIAELEAEIDSLRQAEAEFEQRIAQARAEAQAEGRDPDAAEAEVREQTEAEVVPDTSPSEEAVAAATDTTRAPQETAVQEQEAQEQAAQGQEEQVVRVREERSSNLSNRVIEVPIPEEGEIYLRYGTGGVQQVDGAPQVQTQGQVPAAGLTTAQVRQIVQEVVDERMAEAGGISQEEARTLAREALREELGEVAVTQEDVQTQVQEAVRDRLENIEDGTLSLAELQRLESRIESLDERMSRLRTEGLNRPAETQVVRDREVIRETDDGGSITRPFGRSLTGVQPIGGFRTSDGTTQGILGVRGDFRQAESSIRFIPELSAGFGGDGTSYTLLASGMLPLISVGPEQRITPYTGLGAGFTTRSGLSGLNLRLNVALGVEYQLDRNSVFVEYNTLDFFDVNRVLGGVRIRL